MGCASLKLNEKENRELEKQIGRSNAVGDAINSIRLKPDVYAKIIQQQLKCFKNSRVMLIEQSFNKIQYDTMQGQPAWKEAVKFLKSQQPINSPLIKNPILCEAAYRRATSYSNKQKSPPKQQQSITQEIQLLTGSKVKPGDYAVLVGMDFLLKNRNYVENAVIGLVIDDGVPERMNRRQLFSQKYKYYGSYCTVTSDHVLVVICLASENVQKSNP